MGSELAMPVSLSRREAAVVERAFGVQEAFHVRLDVVLHGNVPGRPRPVLAVLHLLWFASLVKGSNKLTRPGRGLGSTDLTSPTFLLLLDPIACEPGGSTFLAQLVLCVPCHASIAVGARC